MRAPLRLAPGEGLMLAAIGRRQVIDAGKKRAEELAIVDDAADRNAAEADAVIAALAADQAGARALAADVVVGERDLERGIDRLRARIAEEHAIEIARRQRGDPARQLERFGMGEVEGGRVIELGGLPRDRGHDRIAVVAGIGAPQAGKPVEHGAAVGREIMHALGAGDEPRRALEGAIGGEGNPKGLKVVRNLGELRCRGPSSCENFPVSLQSMASTRRGVWPAAGFLKSRQ